MNGVNDQQALEYESKRQVIPAETSARRIAAALAAIAAGLGMIAGALLIGFGILSIQVSPAANGVAFLGSFVMVAAGVFMIVCLIRALRRPRQ
jgi:hypothetical protein